MANLINISSQIDTVLTDASNKTHTNRKISCCYSNFTPASKEAIELNKFEHVGVSKYEILVNRRASLVRIRTKKAMPSLLV